MGALSDVVLRTPVRGGGVPPSAALLSFHKRRAEKSLKEAVMPQFCYSVLILLFSAGPLLAGREGGPLVSDAVREKIEHAKNRSPLFAALRRADVEKVRQLVESGADVNEQDEETGVTPLHLAAVCDVYVMCLFLL